MHTRSGQVEGASASSDRGIRRARLYPLLTLALALGATVGIPAGASSATVAKSPVKVMPQRDWSDAVLYFVIVDRYADGNKASNAKVDLGIPAAGTAATCRVSRPSSMRSPISA